MKDIHEIFGRFLALAMLMGIGFVNLPAQGPPVRLDSCIVNSSLRLKSIPEPGKFELSSYDAFKACTGKNIVQVNKTKIGKARNLKLQLQMHGKKLVRVTVISSGEKSFEKLYEQVIEQAGTPSKMVESKGVLTYSWDLRVQFKANMLMHYIPATKVGTVVILP